MAHALSRKSFLRLEILPRTPVLSGASPIPQLHKNRTTPQGTTDPIIDSIDSIELTRGVLDIGFVEIRSSSAISNLKNHPI